MPGGRERRLTPEDLARLGARTTDPGALVLVGASAGGLAVLRRLLHDLPAGLPATVLAVVHLPGRPVRPLVDLLRGACPLRVRQADVPRRLRSGEVLLAPPDQHLEVVGQMARPSSGLPVRGLRPSVDVLFGSGARAAGRRVVAVVLSGALSDGAAGATEVERAGGRVVVQDPAEALVPGMPASALAATARHDVVATGTLGAAVARLVADVVGAPA